MMRLQNAMQVESLLLPWHLGKFCRQQTKNPVKTIV